MVSMTPFPARKSIVSWVFRIASNRICVWASQLQVMIQSRKEVTCAKLSTVRKGMEKGGKGKKCKNGGFGEMHISKGKGCNSQWCKDCGSFE